MTALASGSRIRAASSDSLALSEPSSRGSTLPMTPVSRDSRTSSIASEALSDFTPPPKPRPLAAEAIQSHDLQKKLQDSTSKADTIKWVGVAILVLAVAAAVICFAPHVGLLGSAGLAAYLTMGGTGLAAIVGASMTTIGHLSSPHREADGAKLEAVESLNPAEYTEEKLQSLSLEELFDLKERVQLRGHALNRNLRATFQQLAKNKGIEQPPKRREEVRAEIYRDLDTHAYRMGVKESLQGISSLRTLTPEDQELISAVQEILERTPATKPFSLGEKEKIFAFLYTLARHEDLRLQFPEELIALENHPSYTALETARDENIALAKRIAKQLNQNNWPLVVREAGNASEASRWIHFAKSRVIDAEFLGIREGMSDRASLEAMTASFQKGKTALAQKLTKMESVIQEAHEAPYSSNADLTFSFEKSERAREAFIAIPSAQRDYSGQTKDSLRQIKHLLIACSYSYKISKPRDYNSMKSELEKYPKDKVIAMRKALLRKKARQQARSMTINTRFNSREAHAQIRSLLAVGVQPTQIAELGYHTQDIGQVRQEILQQNATRLFNRPLQEGERADMQKGVILLFIAGKSPAEMVGMRYQGKRIKRADILQALPGTLAKFGDFALVSKAEDRGLGSAKLREVSSDLKGSSDFAEHLDVMWHLQVKGRKRREEDRSLRSIEADFATLLSIMMRFGLSREELIKAANAESTPIECSNHKESGTYASCFVGGHATTEAVDLFS